MGCGCGKNNNIKQQTSSRLTEKIINGIKVPNNMTPNQRKATQAKIDNTQNNKTKRNQKKLQYQWEKFANKNKLQ
jgi:hypothetical protein